MIQYQEAKSKPPMSLFKNCGRDVKNDDLINSKLIFLKNYSKHLPACQIWCSRDF